MEISLYEIKKDVFVQARGVELGEGLFRLIDCLREMAEIARKEGILALEEAAEEIPPEIALRKEIQWAAQYVCDGYGPDVITELATARYWMNHFQGEDALLYYMIVHAFLRIQAGEDTGFIVGILLSYLPLDVAERYREYREHILEPIAAANRERLFHDAPVLDGQWTLRTLLEEKILQAEDKRIQRVLRDVDTQNCITVLKGLSPAARQKILSNLNERMVGMFAEDWVYMESVSRHDLMEAFAKMICVFDAVENEPGGTV